MEMIHLLLNGFPVGAREATYDEYLSSLTSCGPDDCRYGCYDFEYEHVCEGTSEKAKKEKLLLMSWCPDSAKIKKKMLYSSSFDALKKCLVGVQKYIQVRLQSYSIPNISLNCQIEFVLQAF